MSLSKEHCAKVLLEWVEHHVKKAEQRSKYADANLTEERIQLRIAKALEEERNRRDQNDWNGGFGQPTAEQQYAETLKRMEEESKTASQELQNNRDMLAYIKEITKNDVVA